MHVTCKHCGQRLDLGRAGRHGPTSTGTYAKYRDRLVTHLKQAHAEIAERFSRGFTAAKGFVFAEHADKQPE
jgi:hypothetical protein